MKEELRRVPNKGIGYGLLKYVSEKEVMRREIRERGGAEISFNYLGQFDRMIREEGEIKRAREGSGRTVSDKIRREHGSDDKERGGEAERRRDERVVAGSAGCIPNGDK